MFGKIKQESEEMEMRTTREIHESVNQKRNILVDAGAGSGKTFSLIELLIYLLENNSEKLQSNNQSIMCLTYTNAAVNEIRKRLGNNEIVSVSTIHECFWDLISIYSEELKELHLDRIKEKYHEEKKKYDEAEFHEKSTEERIKRYLDFIAENKSYYYEFVDQAPASEYPLLLKDYFQESEVNRNKRKIQKLSRAYLKYIKYEKFLSENKQLEFPTVTYNAQITYDNILKYQITHESVLKYTLEFVKKYDSFKRIIIDKFPIIIIDEYQDTDEVALEVILRLDKFAKEKNLDLFIAFFGDTAQQIYDVNHFEEIKNYYTDSSQFTKIQKKFNYRSSQKIIDISNKIRDDEIEQTSPYVNSNIGSIIFKKTSIGRLDSEIDKTIEDWEIDKDNKLHCLFLTNKEIAEYIGMGKVYNRLEKMNYYTGLNYKLLNTETLNKNIDKLGSAQSIMNRLLELYGAVNNSDGYIDELFPEELIDKMTVKEARNYQQLLKHNFSQSFTNFKGYLESLFSMLDSHVDDDIGLILKSFLPEDIENLLALQELLAYILREDTNENISMLLDIEFSEFLNWYNYINDSERKKSKEYHTYHGVKGLEFSNVLIILKPNFNRNDDYFENFFLNYGSEKYDDKYVRARNLLYVAATRSILNLKIVYLGETAHFENNLKQIFPKEIAKVILD